MSSGNLENLTAEQRFRQAFERLKANDPTVLARNTPVTQNNVAREAGCDPSALRKSRFPVLIREIQAYIEIQASAPAKNRLSREKRNAKRSATERLEDAIKQRDAAQSQLLSANRRIVELSEEVESLQRRLGEVSGKVTNMRR